MRISDWSSDVCSSDLRGLLRPAAGRPGAGLRRQLADRLARPRPAGARPAGDGRARARRRFRPHRHADDASARTRTPRRVRPAHGLDPGLSTSMPAAARPTLHLVDASLYVFRAWHSMPDEFHDADGWPTNAVHGFARFLLELLERERPKHIVVAFDEALDSCFRNTLYPAYKANRDPAPPELKCQFAYCRALCDALGLVATSHSDYEADDLIGSALHQARAHGHRGVIVSADKDLSQLLGEHDEQWDFARNPRWGMAGVKARHGVAARQTADSPPLRADAFATPPSGPVTGAP